MCQNTTQLLARVRAGDRAAEDELFRQCGARLRAIACRQLRGFQGVQAREQLDDVVQVAAVSLLAALRVVDLADSRAFFRLAGAQTRRRLIELARRHRHRDLPPPPDDPDADLERWAALHEAVERLPEDLREVFSLRFYQGLVFEEIKPLIGASVAEAHRRWHAAVAALEAELRELPL